MDNFPVIPDLDIGVVQHDPWSHHWAQGDDDSHHLGDGMALSECWNGAHEGYRVLHGIVLLFSDFVFI